MATEMSNKLSVREGLIRVVDVERFQSKPRSGGNTHVVVMQKTGSTLRHYCTLRSDSDKLSIGEQLWGSYVCYIVDLSQRELRIEDEFPTQDRITNIKVAADVLYRAVDGERVAIGIEDALQSLREDLATVLRREVVRRPLEQVTEEHLEARLNQESTRFQSRLGIAIERTRVRVDWPEEVLARRRSLLEKKRKQEAEEAERRRDWAMKDQARRRQERLELEDMAHIDTVIRGLGLEALPVDRRLQLQALPRQEALKQIIEWMEEQRKQVREALVSRMREEYKLLNKLIDKGILEEMDLVDFGQNLLERYQHALPFEESLGVSSQLLFGESKRPQLSNSKKEQQNSAEESSESADKSPERNAEPDPTDNRSED